MALFSFQFLEVEVVGYYIISSKVSIDFWGLECGDLSFFKNQNFHRFFLGRMFYIKKKPGICDKIFQFLK
jgi:hypothetical protein